MKKQFKKLISIILSIIMISVPLASNVAAEDFSDDYEFLLEQGYSENFLGNLNANVAERMVETIGQNYVAQIDTESFNFDEQETLTRGAINSSIFTLNITASAICKPNTTKIVSVLVVTTFEWTPNNPLYRGEDAIALNWDTSKFTYEADTFYSADLYKDSANAAWVIFKEHKQPSKLKQGGLGYHTNLKSWVNIVGGQSMFALTPDANIGMCTGTNYSTVINVDYAHQKSAFSGISFSVVDFGVGISYDNCDVLADGYTFRYSKT